MKILIFLTLLGLTRTELIKDFECVRNIKYEKEILKENISGPYQMAIDHDTNTLFFSYAAAQADEYFKIAYLSLTTKKFGLVSGITGGFANTVDNARHIVYMGGGDGIYEFNYDTKAASYLGIPRVKTSIWQMFYSDGLYFTSYPDETPFLYKDGVVVKVPGVAPNRAMTLAVSKSGNIYYANSSGLFSYDKDSGKTVKHDESSANGFSADINGNLYYSDSDGIYYINEKEKRIEKVLSVNDCYGVAIAGNGDIIYAQSDGVTRLKQTSEECVVELEEHKN